MSLYNVGYGWTGWSERQREKIVGIMWPVLIIGDIGFLFFPGLLNEDNFDANFGIFTAIIIIGLFAHSFLLAGHPDDRWD